MLAQTNMEAATVRARCETELRWLRAFVIADALGNSEPKKDAWIGLERQQVAPFVYGTSAHRYDPAPILTGTGI
jgi:hypothetical protein